MKTIRLIIPVAALLLFAGQAAAQSEAEPEAAAAVREAEAREGDVTRKLQEAERKMAEAARQIAELTKERLPEMERRIEIISDGRPRLGINIGGETTGGPVEGVRIVGVTPGSAADDAGLRAGDVITAINEESMSADQPGESTRRILDFMAGIEDGDVLDVEYLRDGKVGTVEVEPRAVEMRRYAFRGFPKDFSMPSIPDMQGAPHMVEKFHDRFAFGWSGNAWSDMELVELNKGLGKYFGAESGVLVVSAPESDALQLEDGDVIRKIDGREPTSVRHAMRILGSYQAGESLEIEILRDKKKRTLEIEIPDARSSMLFDAPAPVRPAVAPRPPAPAPAPRRERT
jgi:C-terminal processing protease CtpA/Prc